MPADGVREVAPAREPPLRDDREAACVEQRAPLALATEGAGACAATPRAVVCAAHRRVPEACRDVFVDDGESAAAQNAPNLAEEVALLLRVVQYVAEQHGVERVVGGGETCAVVTEILDGRVRSLPHVESDDARTDERRQVVRDEAAAAANV